MTGDPGCGGYGRAAGGDDPDATTALPLTPSPEELLVMHQADRLREELELRAGESALLLTRGPGAGSSYRLGEGVVSLGRRSTATILLDDISVSRRHAEVRPAGNTYRIVDVGSLNGTYVNDVRVDEALLAHGQEIRIGLFKLVFLSAGSTGR